MLGFFFHGKYVLLLQAEGKHYIFTNLGMIISTLSNISKILLIYLGYGIVMLQFTYLLINIGQTIFIVLYMRRYYTWIDPSAPPNSNAIAQRNSVFVHQISGLIFGNTDPIILTFFCGLKVCQRLYFN